MPEHHGRDSLRVYEAQELIPNPGDAREKSRTEITGERTREPVRAGRTCAANDGGGGRRGERPQVRPMERTRRDRQRLESAHRPAADVIGSLSLTANGRAQGRLYFGADYFVVERGQGAEPGQSDSRRAMTPPESEAWTSIHSRAVA